MASDPKYYIVEASALPTVFLKVAEAKRLLSTGVAATVNEATQMTDISRSAFYKYRDAVLPFQNMMIGRIITFQLLLQDETGILSTLLNLFAEVNANITTINSIVPTNGCAVVTISAETMDLTVHIEELLRLMPVSLVASFTVAASPVDSRRLASATFRNTSGSADASTI